MAVALVMLAACQSRDGQGESAAAPSVPVAPEVSRARTPAAPLAPAPILAPAPVTAAPGSAEPQTRAPRTATQAVAPAATPTPPGAPFHWRIDVVRDTGGFRLGRALRVPGPPPGHRGGPRGLAWRFRVVDAAGAVLHEGELADPGELRGEFHGAPGETIDAVHTRQPLPLTFSIRVPALPATRIDFFEGATTTPLGSVPFPETP